MFAFFALLGEEIRIENLRPSTNYIFRIRAKNEVGVGPVLDFAHTTEAIRKYFHTHSEILAIHIPHCNLCAVRYLSHTTVKQ